MRKLARLGAYTASVTLVLSGGLVASAPAQAAPAADPVGLNAGVAWLTGQLTGGVIHNTQYDFDDLGLTVDTALALHDIGGHDSTVATILTALTPRAYAEYYTSTFSGVTTTYGGSVGKALVLAEETGADPTSFGGHNLVTLLEDQVATTAPIAGRVQNQNDSFGDANVIGQAFAAHGLAGAGSSEAASVTGFLLAQQCSAGFFRLDFTKDKTAASQGCDDATSEPDTDATAIAIQQLATQSGNGAVATAIAKAKTWLISQQKPDGSWGGGTTTEASNANSTGLAATALGDTPQAASAAQWLRAHQVTYYDVCDHLIRERGAVAYSDASLTAGRLNGITKTTQDQFRRAAAQAVPALAYLPADPNPSHPTLPQPTHFYMAGSSPSLRIGGLKAGDQVCFNGPGTLSQKVSTGSTVEQHLTLPAGTATRSYAVRDAYGHLATTRFKVLGAKRLTVARAPGRVHRSRVVTVALRGLAPHEPARIYYGSTLVRSGDASASGNLVARFSSGRSVGKKSIRGYGRFSTIRKGATSIRVVR